MAQSRINQLDLSQLLAAKKNTGPADAINSGIQGVSTGLILAESLATKRLTQQKAQADIAAKAQELKNKAMDLMNDKQKIQNNTITVPQDRQPTVNLNGTSVPVASYDPAVGGTPNDPGMVTPGYQPADKKMSPEAFNAENPGAEKSFDRAMARAAKNGDVTLEQAATKVQQTKVPESFTPIAEKTGTDTTPGAALVLGSKQSGTREVPLPVGYHTTMELSGTRGAAMEEKNKLEAANKIRTELNPSHFSDPQSKLAAVKVAAAERFEPLLAQMRTQQGQGDRRQLLESARQLDNMLTSSGQSSEAITQAFVPDTLKGKIRNFQELVTNVPVGQDAGAFIDRVADTMHREASTAKGQVKKYQMERIGGLNEARKLVPDTFNAQLTSLGLDPTLVDENGVYREPPPKPDAIHSVALDKANAALQTNPNDPTWLAVKAKAMKELSSGGK